MRSPRRGEIFRLQSDSVGKKRPVLVVSPVQLNSGIYLSAVPFYSQQIEKRRSHRSCVYFQAGEFGLECECVAKTDEVGMYRLSDLRIAEGPVGELDAAKLAEISAALCYSLGIEMPAKPAATE